LTHLLKKVIIKHTERERKILDNSELQKLKEIYLETNKIKRIGKPPKRDTFQTNDILTIYNYGNDEKVL